MNSTSLPLKELLRPDEVANFYNCKIKVIYKYCQNGDLKAYKVKGLLRIERKSVIELLSKSEEI